LILATDAAGTVYVTGGTQGVMPGSPDPYAGENDGYLVAFRRAGAISTNISVTIYRDTNIEPDETFTVTLSNPTGGCILGCNGMGSAPTLVDSFLACTSWTQHCERKRCGDGP
jgi:hypothetical protein